MVCCLSKVSLPLAFTEFCVRRWLCRAGSRHFSHLWWLQCWVSDSDSADCPLTASVSLLTPCRYHSLLELGEKRKGMLEKSCKKFMLFREANELQQWINEKEAALTSEEVGADLEQVEVLQKKFDDFQKVCCSAAELEC